MQILAAHRPQLVSTVLVGLHTESSDVDIVCEYRDPSSIRDTLRQLRCFEGYALKERDDHYLCQFHFQNWLFEIYASTTPVEKQLGYRHFKVMQRLVVLGGSAFQKSVQALKQQGLKTEPAIARLLQLEGDPYLAVLALEKESSDVLAYALKAKLIEP